MTLMENHRYLVFPGAQLLEAISYQWFSYKVLGVAIHPYCVLPDSFNIDIRDR